MSAAEKIPWEQLPMDAGECAELWGVTREHFLERIACRPGFPRRVQLKPAVWLAGEIVDYRNRNRPQRKGRRT